MTTRRPSAIRRATCWVPAATTRKKATAANPAAARWILSAKARSMTTRAMTTRAMAKRTAATNDAQHGDRISPTEPRQFIIGQEQAGQRLDVFLVGQVAGHSRAFLRKLIDAQAALVNRRPAKASYHLRAGDVVTFTPAEPPREATAGEDIPLDVLHEDDWLVVVHKPPGMVVHPGKGNWQGTLAAAWHFASANSARMRVRRPGIVHRLDRDTSGVIVVAKTDAAHAALAAQFRRPHRGERSTLRFLAGTPDRDRDLIDLPICPHPQQREKKAVRRDHPEARPARTLYEVEERFAGFAAVRAFPKTGRTHQIRIPPGGPSGARCYATGCTAAGRRITRGEIEERGGRRDEGGGREEEILLDRQALHATRIAFDHPPEPRANRVHFSPAGGYRGRAGGAARISIRKEEVNRMYRIDRMKSELPIVRMHFRFHTNPVHPVHPVTFFSDISA